MGLAETGRESERTMTLSMVALGLAGLYCLVRAVMDLKHHRFVWGVVGLICAGLILLTPMSSQAVKYDLPRSAAN